MATPRVCVLRAPGTNCDVETAYAFEVSGAKADRVHVSRLLERPTLLADYQVFCVPGGFSYGDDIGAGVILSRKLRGTLGEALAEFLRRDTLTLGICNGFQALLKAGILPDGPQQWPARNGWKPQVSLTWNDNGMYTAIWVRLKAERPPGGGPSRSVFLRGIDEIDLPVAHAEGRVVVSDDSLPHEWRRNGQIAVRYHAGATTELAGAAEVSDGSLVLPYPQNPNGSVANIAGLCDRSGRVLGLMPHPERFLHATQHPQWTRRGLKGEGGGMKLFRNAVDYFA